MSQNPTAVQNQGQNPVSPQQTIFTESGTSGGRGLTYEARFCMFCFVRGYTCGKENFRLVYQAPDIEKFDDVLFDEGENGEHFELVQLKHKENQLKITHSQLFTEKCNTDYNLLKYVKAFNDLILKDKYKDGKVKRAVVLTNIEFDLHAVQNSNDVLNLNTNVRPNQQNWYKCQGGNVLTSIQFVPAVINDTDSIIFGSSSPLTKYGMCYKFDNPNFESIIQKQAVTLGVSFGDDEISNALKHIVYAVNQPNDEGLVQIIKKMLEDHFKLHEVESVYDPLEKLFRDYCDTKKPIDPTSHITQPPPKQHTLTYKDADILFQKKVKRFSYGVVAPTSSFTGRLMELTDIKTKLSQKNTIVVSQIVTINGLGGIGKTELTRYFIKKYGIVEFYGRIIWIEAENDDSVKYSFEQVAHRLNIKMDVNKGIKTLISEVFAYFEGMKLLVVFDNFDGDTRANKDNLVVYCRETVSDTTKEHRPYFIFTSRNRKCLPGVPFIDLGVFSEEDALQLIRTSMSVINPSDQDAAELAVVLQYFPLALRQAIAYIIEQHENNTANGFDIGTYISKFNEEQQALLNFSYPNDFGRYEKTTFITWNITLEAIRKDAISGENAIKTLQFIAYLYADDISSSLFSSIFDNDSIEKAFALLKKYSMITKKTDTTYQIHRLVQTVIQLKFKDDEENKVETVLKLINPLLYERYFDTTYRYDKFDLMEKCTIEQMLHYNTVSVHIHKHNTLKAKYDSFLYNLRDRVLYAAVFKNDVDKIKAVNFSNEDLKAFLERNIEYMIERQANESIKYFVDKGHIILTDPIIVVSIQEMSYYEMAQEKLNLELYKFIVEQEIDDKFRAISSQTLHEVINGNLGAVQQLINDGDKKLCEMLRECLFYAVLFKHLPIVQYLTENQVSHNCRVMGWTPIHASAMLKYSDILRYLVQKSDQTMLKNNLFKLLADKYFTDTAMFQIIFDQYVQLGGTVNDEDDQQNSFLCYSVGYGHYSIGTSMDKSEIIKFLLNNGADPCLKNKLGQSALLFMIETHAKGDYNGNISLFDELYNQTVFSNMSPQKFMDIVIKGIFTIQTWMENAHHKNLFDKLVKIVGEINIRNDEGATILINYVQYEDCNIENVKFLIEKGVKIDSADINGNNALFYAINNDDPNVFIHLLKNTEKVDDLIVEQVILSNKLTIAQELFEKIPRDYRFSDGKTAIKLAVEHFSTEIVFILEEQFKEYCKKTQIVNIKDVDGNTLLIKYLKEEKSATLKQVKILVENGIDVDSEDNSGKSAMDYAEARIEIVTYLLSKVSTVNPTKFLDAILHNKLAIVKLLCPKHFLPDKCLDDGKTALEVAIPHQSIFMYLLKYVSTPDKNVLSKALTEFIIKDDPKIVKEILGKCSDPELTNGTTPIKFAVENLSIKVVLSMKEEFSRYKNQGEDVNITNTKGETLLLKYIKSGKSHSIEDMEFLINNGVNVHARDQQEKNVLYYSLNLKNDDIFKYLLTHFDPNGNQVDEEILIKSIESNKFSNVKLLCPKEGLKYFETDYQCISNQKFRNNTPLDIAIICGAKKDIKNYLKEP